MSYLSNYLFNANADHKFTYIFDRFCRILNIIKKNALKNKILTLTLSGLKLIIFNLWIKKRKP